MGAARLRVLARAFRRAAGTWVKEVGGLSAILPRLAVLVGIIAALSIFGDDLTRAPDLSDEPDWAAIAERAERQAEREENRLRRIESSLSWSSWAYLGTACFDGWSSSSIGKQGACSWHGGVADFFQNDAGERLRCSTGDRPPTQREAAEQIAQYDEYFCVAGSRW